MTPNIHLAFRFHGNFYHSYRGDTPDELGFGKDIRIIRHLLDTLDALNARGIPVRGTWDFENYFSLERIMPEYCPDLIERLRARAGTGRDEMQLMSYNNGLISAHTAREFEEAIRRGMTNAKGSGLADLFGEFGRGAHLMVRPQEMLYTPIHLKLYRACGIDAISLYYSALPFNAFSTFISPLTFAERYNPLTLTYPGIDETMTLLPCYSVGDLADHLTLRRWVKQMRRQQLALKHPVDALLLLDMDADDEFWAGFEAPLFKGRFSTASGLKGLVENVADLDYVRWTTPGEYLEGRPPVGSTAIGQDTADGSFDGFSSWAEKWSNHRLWTGLERARILELQACRLLIDDVPSSVAALLDESFEARLKLLSTTHFGMAAPVMNLAREGIGRDLARSAVEKASEAFDIAAGERKGNVFSLLDYARGRSTQSVRYESHPSTALIRLPLRESAPDSFVIRDLSGRAIPSAIARRHNRREVLFVESFEASERKDYVFSMDEPAAQTPHGVTVTQTALTNAFLSIGFDRQGQASSVRLAGDEFALGPFLRTGLSYAGQTYEVETWKPAESLALGVVGLVRSQGQIVFKGGYVASFERELLLASGLPYLYLTMRAIYPRTPDKGYDRGKAVRLQQAWDSRWQEISPCEIRPALSGTSTSPLRVWKHNFCDHVSSYTLDYGRFSENDQLDSANNHVTHGWVAVSDGARGVLVAQSADALSGMAFCPLRTRRQGGSLRVRFNPFGTYWGKQYRYAIADTGLGNLLATRFSASDHVKPYAPSYNGRVHEFSLMIAPYAGDAPRDAVRYAAEAFAYPHLVLEDDGVIAPPAHRSWDGAGLGKPSPAHDAG